VIFMQAQIHTFDLALVFSPKTAPGLPTAATGSSHHLSAVFGAADSASFWKRGSFRSGSNIGSSGSSP